MDDKRLNDLLRWSIENSDATRNDPSAQPPAEGGTQLTPEVMAALMGGPSDADLMKASMEIISAPISPDVSLEDKLIAFDNFEQLIEGLDNANNIANLGLWTPLLEQLAAEEPELRRMAAWCIGTAVQNNERTQERLLAVGGLPHLVGLATKDTEKEDVRKKAIYALSSACRNYQPAMDACADELSKVGHETGKVDATSMEAVDEVMNALRAKAKAA
ncbi:nucleotide exchange factor Fes1 [Purpureocillium lilacinum]|uniref:Nucleotide exchange factor Fes1 n=2 Tax=Purpureocillium lilacinum TaxID=33203 RepID=A0A179GJ96_PURLI|nr:nucleotide exchange factor Fes1 [Purpureocillium lilacinum]KAK4086146.1 hypothetical protein Purlil1_9458 [Purpureocillium lilacinum]OAQ77441.1 nucleotide exchange factor Fes1 [Purpureocillium lilacinum]OAQ85548.1 nucleotide exchange factor Fes1 [Purpureocillium lilacinum]PWI69639.1 Hsp70 nucleotide exchange factor FES1 [Purpureocillium lilacinum]GJN75298.1 hsp70 nucleotide exchange factor fes1 [Purpureocillium lilacinum]